MTKHDMVKSLPVSAKLTLRLNTALVTFVTSPLPAANTLNERRRAWNTNTNTKTNTNTNTNTCLRAKRRKMGGFKPFKKMQFEFKF